MSVFISFVFVYRVLPDTQPRREHHIPQNWRCRVCDLPVGAKIPTPVLRAAAAAPSLQLLILLLMLMLNMIKTSSLGLCEYSVVHHVHTSCVSGFDSSRVVKFGNSVLTFATAACNIYVPCLIYKGSCILMKIEVYKDEALSNFMVTQ